MSHPTMLSDALDCDMVIGGELWNGMGTAPHLNEIILSEVKELWNTDVPYFWTTPESRDLYSSQGKKYRNFFGSTGMEAVRKRIDSLPAYTGIQVNAIRSSVKSTVPLNLISRYNSLPETAAKKAEIPKARLISLASRIGSEILQHLHSVGSIPFGIGMTPLEEHNYTSGLLPMDFYDGIPGIGVFLGYLSRFTGSKVFLDAAMNAHRLIRMLFLQKNGSVSCGAFSGLTGLIYADLHLSALFDTPPSPEVLLSFKNLKRLIRKDENFDLINGAAGALLVLLRYHARTGSPEALELASLAAERLREKAEPQNTGIAWHTMKKYDVRLGGLSHGVTGIAWALTEWYEQTRDDLWKDLALQAFSYEESQYDNEKEAWIDLRRNTPTCFWCYGASGIGIGATHLRSILGGSKCDGIIARAQRATWRYGFSTSHCICHGDLGNAELFWLTGKKDLSAFMLTKVLDDYTRNRLWRCALPADATTPGMMCGLAGIGYSFLRFAAPGTVPSILNLEAP